MNTRFQVTGGQWGDEGKGKALDFLTTKQFQLLPQKIKDFYIKKVFNIPEEKFSSLKLPDPNILILRYQGGANAGHTIVIGDKKYHAHQIPSSITRPYVYNLLGSGMFIHVSKLVEELNIFENFISKRNFGISSRAHVTLDYHVNEDAENFNIEDGKHTSTGSGIKQTARDKANRTGIRFVEFLDHDSTVKILNEKVFPNGVPKKYDSAKKLSASYDGVRRILESYLVSQQEIENNPKFLFKNGEGAQGIMLSEEQGQYPGTTSSKPELSEINPHIILGVFKAYNSNVGIGDRPFVGKLESAIEDSLREDLGEFGTTTGRPRNIGYFDLVAAKYAVEAGRIDILNISCLDKMEVFEKHGVPTGFIVAYEIDGHKYDSWDVSFDNRFTLWKAKPIIEYVPGWTETIVDGKLHPNAEAYMNIIKDRLQRPVALIGTGPGDTEMIIKENIFTYQKPT